jgi:hypothetical protein
MNRFGLAYILSNPPLRAYGYALGELPAQLDAVEIDGEEEVRAQRRAVVKEWGRLLQIQEGGWKGKRGIKNRQQCWCNDFR